MRAILLLAILLFASSASAEWVEITLKQLPYRDTQGNVLSPEDLNRPSRAGIYGGGKEGYPNISKSKIVEWHEKGTTLIINGNVTQTEVQAMKGDVLTDLQAVQVKKVVFGVKAESGVTK